jgi:hypothetical protein
VLENSCPAALENWKQKIRTRKEVKRNKSDMGNGKE